ncbi:MAG: hypothetical protein NTW50_02875 [Candidatus Berkelbacteria bacterium]|nr:hypothetical protein [Candidatus Berkelbacteria bacterium]
MIEKVDNLIRKNDWQKYLTKQYFGYFVLVCFGILGLFSDWNAKELVLILFLIWLVLFPLATQVLAKISALFLALTALTMALNQANRAEIFSELAYLFLILAVIMTILQFSMERKKK